MTDRSYRRGRDDRRSDSTYSHQAEQFESDRNWRGDEYRQMGDTSHYSEGNTEYGEFDAGQPYDRYAGRSSGRNNRDRDGDRNPSYGSRHSAGRFAASNYREHEPAGFGSFTSNDFGGRDFSGLSHDRAGRPYTGFGNQAPGYSAYGGSRREYDDGERGWLDRAGDEIASWFGDEEAARRREQDHSGRGPSGYIRSDQRILEDVSDELTRDWRVDATNITVTVQDGEVTLDGTVPSRSQKRRAEDISDDVSGVKNVQNNLRVQDTGATV